MTFAHLSIQPQITNSKYDSQFEAGNFKLNEKDFPASITLFNEVFFSNILRLMDKLMPGKINWSDKTFQTPKIDAMRVMRERERIALFNKMTVEYGVS